MYNCSLRVTVVSKFVVVVWDQEKVGRGIRPNDGQGTIIEEKLVTDYPYPSPFTDYSPWDGDGIVFSTLTSGPKVTL